ncbi:MAG: Trm112 family protein [Terracidiphilus sp.]
MAALPMAQSGFDANALAQLACPACHEDLHAEESRLVCGACGRRYPIVDGIPALIVERAETEAAREM